MASEIDPMRCLCRKCGKHHPNPDCKYIVPVDFANTAALHSTTPSAPSVQQALAWGLLSNKTNAPKIRSLTPSEPSEEWKQISAIEGETWVPLYAAPTAQEASKPVQAEGPDWRKSAVTLSALQLKEALDFAAPDFDQDEGQRDTEVCIAWAPENTVRHEEGGFEAPGYVVWLEEYPEEGCMPLDGANPIPYRAPPPQQADAPSGAGERMSDKQAAALWQKCLSVSELDGYSNHGGMELVRAVEAATRATSGNGGVLMPYEPTDEMETAAENAYEESGSTFPNWKAAYRAMRDAALSAQPAAKFDVCDFIEGMSVSVDVSTDEATSEHRYFGTVTEVMEDPGSKHGVTLLVQDAEPNFDRAQPAAGAQQAAPSVPTVCDGKEQEGFESWAKGERYDMSEHPLHWLFLNEKTYAARQGWKAALEYVGKALASPPAGLEKQEGGAA